MRKVQMKQMKRRAEIIETVLPLLETVPFEELSVTEICKYADISVGTFYHYFTTKSDLLVGLLGLIDGYFINEVFPLLTSENEAENLRLFAHQWAMYVDAHGLERSRLISSATPSEHYLNGERREILDVLEGIFRRGQEKKQFLAPEAPEKLTELFLLLIRGVCVDWSRRSGSYSVIERTDELGALFLRGILSK